MLSVLVILVAACTGPGTTDDPEAAPDLPDSTEGATGSDDEADGEASTDPEADAAPGADDDELDNPGSGAPGDDGTDVAELLSALPGQLAIGDGTRVLVGRPDGRSLVEVDGGSDVLASQPTWSRSGQKLVWTSATAEAQLARVLEFDAEGVPVGEPIDSDTAGPPIFYYQWDFSDERLLYLRNSPAGAQVEAGWLTQGGDAVPVTVGTPLFAAWSPDGQTMAVHRNDFEIGTFDQFADEGPVGDPELSVPTAELPRTRGEFTTPAWLDDTTMLVVGNGSLRSVDIDPTRSSLTFADELVSDVGSIRFVLSPDGSKVAYQRPPEAEPGIVEVALPAQSPTPRPIQSPVGALVVSDLQTGAEALVSESVAIAWEWSPDGSRLAWLEADRAGRARWQFWSADPNVGGNLPGNSAAPPIGLSRKYLSSYLPFFAQYTHSVTGWSPDSSAFATAGSIDGRSAVWVHLVDTDIAPIPVADGDFVTWGGGPTPPVPAAPIT